MTMGKYEVRYFEWLVNQIHLEMDFRNQFIPLFDHLHRKEFIWLVPHDDNRVADGYALRAEFMGGVHHAFPFGVSTLEVLVGLSRRVAFQTDGEPEWWAWKLIENLKLDKMKQDIAYEKKDKIDKILDDLIYRRYKPNGEGGFFPLPDTDDDQTKVEIWRQMSAYVVNVVGI
jgi:hypothetical protein